MTPAVAVVGAIAVAVLAGAWASRLVAPVSGTQAPASRIVRAGPARLMVPATWTPVAMGSTGIASLDSEHVAVLDPTPGASERVIVALGRADDPSLIPEMLRTLLRDPVPRARGTSLGRRPAWSYRVLATRRPRLLMEVTVLPTTEGVIAVACASPADVGAPFGDCASEVESVSLPGAATLMPSPSVALASRLPGVLARLDRARAEGRGALRRADTGEAQALAAHRLADRHLAAAEWLDREFGAPSGTLANSLARSGRAYAKLGGAAADGSARRFDSARRDVRIAEAGLAAAIDDVFRHGTRRTAPTAAASRGGPPVQTGSLAPGLSQFLLVILALAASGAAGFYSSGPVTAAAGRVARGPRSPERGPGVAPGVSQAVSRNSAQRDTR